MLIELIIVGLVITMLYSKGYLAFGNTSAIFISIGVAFVVGGLTWLVTRLLAQRFVDNLFGINAWTAGSKQRLKPLARGGKGGEPGMEIPLPELEKLSRKHPEDTEISRRLSESYLAAGKTESFFEERRRMLKNPSLTTREFCAIVHRLVDVELRLGRKVEALEELRSLITRFSKSSEAVNAKRRLEAIEMDSGELERDGKGSV